MRGGHFDREVIFPVRAVVPALQAQLRDLVEMMAERGLHLAHTTILRWVRSYAPVFISSGGSQDHLQESNPA